MLTRSPHIGPISQDETVNGVRIAIVDEPNTSEGTILQDQRDAKRQHQLRVVPIAFKRTNPGAADSRYQRGVDGTSEHEQQAACENRRNVGSDHRPKKRLYAKRSEQEKRSVHPDHHEIALRKIDDAHDAEDHGKADAHQPLDRADENARHQNLQEASTPCDPINQKSIK
jgi:hypothetical protein